MIRLKRFINQLMESNCYVIYNDITLSAIIIDPASENSEKEIAFIDSMGLKLQYLILTHEHTDHNWGINSLRKKYSAKLVCTEECNRNIAEVNRCYFLFYFDRLDYNYTIDAADIIITPNNLLFNWDNYQIEFILTPGHSEGSTCILIENNLFTGDTIMPCRIFIPKKGGSKQLWQNSVRKIKERFKNSFIMIYPGHGDCMSIKEIDFDNYS